MFRFSRAEEVWMRAYCSALEGAASCNESVDYSTRFAVQAGNQAVDEFCKRFKYDKELAEENDE